MTWASPTSTKPKPRQTLIAAVEALGQRARAWECDAGDDTQTARFHAEAATWAETAPSVMVNNAGIQTWSSLLDLEARRLGPHHRHQPARHLPEHPSRRKSHDRRRPTGRDHHPRVPAATNSPSRNWSITPPRKAASSNSPKSPRLNSARTTSASTASPPVPSPPPAPQPRPPITTPPGRASRPCVVSAPRKT